MTTIRLFRRSARSTCDIRNNTGRTELAGCERRCWVRTMESGFRCRGFVTFVSCDPRWISCLCWRSQSPAQCAASHLLGSDRHGVNSRCRGYIRDCRLVPVFCFNAWQVRYSIVGADIMFEPADFIPGPVAVTIEFAFPEIARKLDVRRPWIRNKQIEECFPATRRCIASWPRGEFNSNRPCIFSATRYNPGSRIWANVRFGNQN
jgi:hypothetical protein